MNDTITADELEGLLSEGNPPRVIDVRRKADRQRDPSMIPAAIWKNPEDVDTWGDQLRGQEVVIYCARGGSVSKSTLEKLHEHDIKARYIEGGFEAWKKTGKSVIT